MYVRELNFGVWKSVTFIYIENCKFIPVFQEIKIAKYFTVLLKFAEFNITYKKTYCLQK